MGNKYIIDTCVSPSWGYMSISFNGISCGASIWIEYLKTQRMIIGLFQMDLKRIGNLLIKVIESYRIY